MTIKNYSIITERNITGLVKKVKEYIRGGWQPLGGVTAINDGKTLQYVQAVVQYHK